MLLREGSIGLLVNSGESMSEERIKIIKKEMRDIKKGDWMNPAKATRYKELRDELEKLEKQKKEGVEIIVDKYLGVNPISEITPPGWSGTVKAMKDHPDIDNPFALAWWMKKRGAKSHKKPEKKED